MRMLPDEVAGVLGLAEDKGESKNGIHPIFRSCEIEERAGGGRGWMVRRERRTKARRIARADRRSYEEIDAPQSSLFSLSLSLSPSLEQAGSRQKAISVMRPPPHSLAAAISRARGPGQSS